MPQKESAHLEQVKPFTEVNLNKQKIKKISKKIYQTLKTKTESADLSLSMVQESFASALGFRNWNSLEKQLRDSDDGLSDLNKTSYIITKQEGRKSFSSNKQNLSEWLLKFNVENITNLLLLYIDNDTMWSNRAATLGSSLSMLITEIVKHNKSIIRDYSNILQLMELENLVSIVKDGFIKLTYDNNVTIEYKVDISTEDKKILTAYLITLPSFQWEAIKLSDTTLEQHGYLVYYIAKAVELLKFVEFSNLSIWNPKWETDENKVLLEFYDYEPKKEAYSQYQKMMLINLIEKDIYEDYKNNNCLTLMNLYEVYMNLSSKRDNLKKMIINLNDSFLIHKKTIDLLNKSIGL